MVMVVPFLKCTVQPLAHEFVFSHFANVGWRSTQQKLKEGSVDRCRMLAIRTNAVASGSRDFGQAIRNDVSWMMDGWNWRGWMVSNNWLSGKW